MRCWWLLVVAIAACGRLDFDPLPGGDDDIPPVMLTPSNGIDATLVSEVSSPVTVTGIATFDPDSGAVTGGLTRAPGEGVKSSIGYHVISDGTAVFVFDRLDVPATAEIRFAESVRAVVFLVGTTATIDGTIDGSAGCYGTDRQCPGPGGGHGATNDAIATGCGGGGKGNTNGGTTRDGGGGGGGGAGAGRDGGDGTPTQGGSAGAACMASDLVPLIGGSGGGSGGRGGAPGANPAIGGGGGGGIQISALAKLQIGGTIAVNGEGGNAGPGFLGNAGAGSGGGAGGGILLEAPTIAFAAATILAANGGAGGGGSHDNLLGDDGESGTRTTAPAAGGAPMTNTNGRGGDGGARGGDPAIGGNGSTNGGGGGGGVGAIHLRAATEPAEPGVVSPPWTFATL